MSLKKAETAKARARLYPSTYKLLKLRAAQDGTTIAEVVDAIERYVTSVEVQLAKSKKKRR